MAKGEASRDVGLFGPDSVSWKVNRETTVLFGGARALLMQAAHPLVLAGARQTGFYERNPWKRMERTLQLTFTITFGTREEALGAADRLNRVHLAVGALDEEGRERFHQEQMVGAELLGLDRARIPPTVAALRAYIDDVLESGILRVTGETLRVADLIRRPPPEVPWRPVLWRVARWAFGTLPDPLRRAYGVRWNALREAEKRGSLLTMKLMRPLIPSTYREIFPARQAARRLAATA